MHPSWSTHKRVAGSRGSISSACQQLLLAGDSINRRSHRRDQTPERKSRVWESIARIFYNMVPGTHMLPYSSHAASHSHPCHSCGSRYWYSYVCSPTTGSFALSLSCNWCSSQCDTHRQYSSISHQYYLCAVIWTTILHAYVILLPGTIIWGCASHDFYCPGTGK